METRFVALLLVAIIGWTVLAPPVARADAAVDAAVRANEVNRKLCGDAYSADVDRAADATRRVADAWAEVDRVHEQTRSSYLLFWRGVLAQCLGRPESARDDLEQFVAAEDRKGPFADLVRQAERRLRRLGRKSEPGSGPLAEYLRTTTVLDLELAYHGGLVVQAQACADDRLAWVNEGCVGVGRPDWMLASPPVGLPLELEVAAAGYPSRVLGIGARLLLSASAESTIGANPEHGHPDYPYASPGLPPTRIGPSWSLLAGPVFRLQTSRHSARRGVRAALMPALYLRHERISPWAGNIVDKDTALRFAGTYGWTRPGAGLRVEILLETSRKVGLRWAIAGGWCPPRRDPELVTVTEPSSAVSDHTQMPSPVQLAAAMAGLDAGLLIPIGRSGAALVPGVGVSWQFSEIGFPDDESHVWVSDVLTADGPAEQVERVYSTQQHLVSIRLELGLRWGLSGARPAPSEAGPVAHHR
jgi:hypothetical protein